MLNFSLGLALLSAPAQAQTSTQKMLYEVYAGGINAVVMNITLANNPAGPYSFDVEASTQGFLRRLVPWNGTFETHGHNMPDGNSQPDTHQSTAQWKDNGDTKKYTYKDGEFESLHVIEADQDVTPKNISPELTEGTTDILSATMDVLKTVAAGNECTGTADIFDGDRRFTMAFNNEGTEQLTPSEYNVYAGEATRCTVEVKPGPGKWASKPRGWLSIQEQGRNKGTMPTVWLAQLAEGQPAVPVKVMVKTDYGTLFSHLVSYENDGKVVLAQAKPGEDSEDSE